MVQFTLLWFLSSILSAPHALLSVRLSSVQTHNFAVWKKQKSFVEQIHSSLSIDGCELCALPLPLPSDVLCFWPRARL